MNDIPDSSQAFRLISYAVNIISAISDSGLTKMQYWLALNKLRPNIDKAKYMVFHPYQKDVTRVNPTLKINDIDIERVTASELCLMRICHGNVMLIDC